MFLGTLEATPAILEAPDADMLSMINTQSHQLPCLSGYTFVELLYKGSRTKVYRAVEESSQQSVVIKLLHQEYPSFYDLLQFRNQYTIVNHLNVPGVIRPHRLEPYGNSYALIMEDFGGISLKDWLIQKGQEWSSQRIGEVLAIAVQLTEILHNIHQQRVIHKDIKPANILIHPQSQEVQLIDFSIASLLPKETQEIQNPNVLEGTLAYLAPEQTGRMNRGIDYRADFYALGVTLYQLLTGQLPFIADEPLDLIHCHMAKTPVPADQVQAGVPRMVAAMVSKLMAKNAEDRYQSALGIQHDVQQCLDQWQATGAITNFELGQRDLSDRFLIPEKLYGREAEVQALLDAFDRVARGSAELMLVAGFSGIGKTAVINEVHKPMARSAHIENGRQRSYFIKGKFDQFNRNIPLSAFVQALRDLMEQLLSESDTQLAQWQAKILVAVGENGQVLIEVIPELEQIIGKQPPALELSGIAAQNRFNLLFQKFIAVFTTAEHPLVLFLDDLQWADSASLQLIKLLMNDDGYLLMLGAYRDNEVSPIHPFSLMVEELKQAQVIVHTITLTPLVFEETNRLVADTLNCSRELAKPLTELVDRKTHGNPFFTTQFLKALHEDGQIRFNHDCRCWECDIAQVSSLSLTDDVVEFMAVQLQKLPDATQQVLKLAACIGNQFDLSTLAIVSEQSPTETASALWKALQEGLIIPITETYKFFHNADANFQADRVAVPYKFLHDRVQQAAYSLIEATQKQATHLCMGTLLLGNLSTSEREDRLFEIVNHFNIGKASIDQPIQRKELAQLNFLAGCKAKASTAYAAALSYIEVAIELLPDNCFESHYDLSFNLYTSRAEVEYLNGNLKAAETWINRSLEQAKTPLEKADVYNMAILQYTLQAKYPEAIQSGRQALALVGIDLPQDHLESALDEELSISTKILKGNSFELLSRLPIMVQPEQKMAIKLLISMGPPTYRSHQRLWSVICAKAVNLCLQYGNTPEIGYIYPAFGGLRGYALNNYQDTDQLLDITLKLIQAFNNKSAESVAYLMIGSSLRHWSHSLKAATEDYLSSYRVGLESSNLQYAAYAFGHNMYCRFYQSLPLDQLFEEITESLNFSRKHKNQWAIDLMLGGQAIVAELTGIQGSARFLESSTYRSEEEYLEQCEKHKNWQVICIFNILKTQVAFVFDRLDESLRYGIRADAEIINVAPQGLLPYAHHLFIYTLLLAALYPQASEVQKLEYWKKIETYQRQLEIWAQNCPHNFLHLYDLVQAEVARISGNYLAAIELYDHAITGASEKGYLQEEALASELAAKFYLGRDKQRVAAGYLQEAYYCYARWGATAKMHDLEHRYPELLHPILQKAAPGLNPLETLSTITDPNFSIHAATQSSRSSSTSVNTVLDFATILKASQTLSSTIKLEELIYQLTQIVLQYSGGDRCVLICPNAFGQWCVEAIATPETTELCSTLLEENTADLPIKLIQYVKHTHTMAVIDDLQTDLPVIDDYLMQVQPRSVSCLPLLSQGQLIGILALENRSMSGMFTHDRILVLNFLCTQAAISLENARLYDTLQHSETKFRTFVEDVNDLIYAITPEATFTYLSPQFKDMWGYEVDEFLNQSFVPLVHPDDLAQVIAAHEQILASGQKQSGIEFRTRHQDGSWLWITCNNSPIKDGQGNVVGVRGIARDISDRKRAEEALLESEAYHRDLLERSAIGLVLCRMDGSLVYANAALAHIIGRAPDEVLTLTYWQLTPEKYADAEQQQLLNLQNTGCYGPYEKEYIHKEGYLVPVRLSGVLVERHGEQFIWSSVEDISDRKAAEATILQKTQELEQALQHAQSAQLQMVQSEKMASLGNLVAGVAHEINNPIGFLNGSISNAKDYVQDLLSHLDLYQRHYPDAGLPVQEHAEEIDLAFLSADLPKLLESMKGATDRIKSISTSLRTFSRADTEYKVRANLHEGLDSALLILKYRLKANESRPAIQVIQEYGELPPIDCFPGQLNQVFMNILANAIDVFDEATQHFSFQDLQAQPQEITIRTAVVTAESAIEVCIRDNGSGMSEEVRSRIFDHLFTTKGVGKGTGLGLAIARQIVTENHGGSLEVWSELGQGTEFCMRLPISAVG